MKVTVKRDRSVSVVNQRGPIKVVVGGRGVRGPAGVPVPKGAWSGATTYAKGEWVRHGLYSFASKVDGNLNHEPDDATPDDTADWMLVPTIPGEAGTAGEPAVLILGGDDLGGAYLIRNAPGAASYTFIMVELFAETGEVTASAVYLDHNDVPLYELTDISSEDAAYEASDLGLEVAEGDTVTVYLGDVVATGNWRLRVQIDGRA